MKAIKKTVPWGYFHIPGTGPKGETCGTCRHAVRFHQAKVWYKCGRNEVRWTGGRATDILIKTAACKYWEGE